MSTSLWHGLVDTLRLLPSVPSKTSEHSSSENQTINEALNKINELITLRKGESTTSGSGARSLGSNWDNGTSNPTINVSAAAAAATPGITTPSSGGGIGKRKRRLSISVSPAPAGLQSTLSVDSNLSPLPSPAPPARANSSSAIRKDRSETPSARDQKTSTKEPYADQLPLEVGRRVACKMPNAEGEDQEWILATIKKCVLKDESRYIVFDADDPTKYVVFRFSCVCMSYLRLVIMRRSEFLIARPPSSFSSFQPDDSHHQRCHHHPVLVIDSIFIMLQNEG